MLVDREVIVCRVEVQALTEIGYSIELERFMERFIGKAARDSRTIIEAELGPPAPADFNGEATRRVADAFARELKPVDGVSEALAELTTLKCVVSSSLPDRIAYSLRLTGLAESFGTSLFSAAMVGARKAGARSLPSCGSTNENLALTLPGDRGQHARDHRGESSRHGGVWIRRCEPLPVGTRGATDCGGCRSGLWQYARCPRAST